MTSKDLATQLRPLHPGSHIVSPFPKQVIVYGGERFRDFTFQGVGVEWHPLSEKPSMFDGPKR